MSLSALTVILFNRCDTQLWLMVVDRLVACTEDNTRCLDAIRISDLWFQASAATAAMPAVPTCAAEASAAAPAMPAAAAQAYASQASQIATAKPAAQTHESHARLLKPILHKIW